MSEASCAIDVDSESEEESPPSGKMMAVKAGCAKRPVGLIPAPAPPMASLSAPALTPAEVELQELKLKHEKLLQLYQKQFQMAPDVLPKVPAVASPPAEKPVFTPSPVHVVQPESQSLQPCGPVMSAMPAPVPELAAPAASPVHLPKMVPVPPVAAKAAHVPQPSSPPVGAKAAVVADVPQPSAPPVGAKAQPSVPVAVPKAPSVSQLHEQGGGSLKAGEEALAEELNLDAEDRH